MSPTRPLSPTSSAAEAAVIRLRSDFGQRIRDARLARRWSTAELGVRAGVSRWAVYVAERADAVSLDVMVRLATALGLRLEIDLADPRRRQPVARLADPVHSAMGELEVAHLRQLSFPIAIDEPYQHYQFAGRADVVAWDIPTRAGSFNAKRAYLGRVLADRLGVGAWRSETHVIVALWSAEILHALRLRSESFRAICPDEPLGFAGWWQGEPPATGKRSEFVVFDPLAAGRQRRWLGLDAGLTARARHRGYADVARLLTRAA
jgi:transcriptional regulator with XRE-family HTH domain